MVFSLTTLFILPVIYWRKGRITSSRHDPYGLGYTRVSATRSLTKEESESMHPLPEIKKED